MNDQVRLRSSLGDYGEKPLRRYRLTETLTAGGSAAAVFVAWDAADGEYEDTTQTFTLYSFSSATGSEGDKGYCYYSADRQRWEAIANASGAGIKKVTFVLPEALTTQAFVGGCPVVNDWYSNSGVTSVEVYNEAGWQGDAGAEGYAEYRPSDNTWPITLLPCPQGSS